MKNRTRKITRRLFIQRTAAAVPAVLAAPIIVPGSVLGKQGAAPGERIAVGIIGAGKMANDYHIPSLLALDDVRVLAVCDVDTTRRLHAKRRVDEKYQAANGSQSCDAYNDFREIIGRQDIDAVLIATPDHWHTIPLVEACKAGKDVYCEKPLTLTIREAKLSIDAVRRFDRVMQTGSQQRSGTFGPFLKACEIVRSGRLGKIKRVWVGVGGPSGWCDLPEEPMEPGLDWNLWLGQAPERPYNSVLSPRGVHNHFPAWRSYREYSGGGLTDMGAHHFDIAQWCLDMDTSGPVEVIPPDDPDATTGCKLIYSNGVEMTHGGPGGCAFEGERGTMRIDRGHLSSKPESIVQEPLASNDFHIPPSPGHHRNWIDCVRSRQKPVADVEVGARSVTVCHLANLGYWYHRKLCWDPQNWEFVGSEEDKQLVDRPRRAPWQLPTI